MLDNHVRPSGASSQIVQRRVTCGTEKLTWCGRRVPLPRLP